MYDMLQLVVSLGTLNIGSNLNDKLKHVVH